MRRKRRCGHERKADPPGGLAVVSYVPLVRIEVLHSYFREGRARALAFLPLGETEAFLKSFGVLRRADGGSLTLQAEVARLEEMARECLGPGEGMLDFLLLATDPLWQAYTQATEPAVPVFARAGNCGELVRLDPPRAADEASAPAALPPGPARAKTPVARLRLSLNPEGATTPTAWRAGLGGAHTLHLEARSTTWKYVLMDDWQGHAPRIRDAAGQIEFEAPQAAVMDHGAPALVSRSLQPIPLQERATHRFQLLDVGVQPERVLITCLPAASPQRFSREVVNGKSVFISEIFHNR